MTSANPITVPVRPLASLYAASTIIPAAAMAAPTRLCRWKRSPENATARPIVKNTCIWMTSDDSPAGIPSLMPEEQQAELADADREAVRDDVAPRHLPAAG